MVSRIEYARQHPDSVQASLLNAVRRLFEAHGFGHTIPRKMAIDATSDFLFCYPAVSCRILLGYCHQAHRHIIHWTP